MFENEDVAKVVEHQPCKQKALSSIASSKTTTNPSTYLPDFLFFSVLFFPF
jgi:hypothetical protein